MQRKITEVTETVNTDRVTEQPARANTQSAAADAPDKSTLASRIIYLIGGILLALLGIRVLLSLLGANRTNGFADLIYGITYPFVAPFFGLFGYEVEYGQSRLEIETIVAMLVYGLLIYLLVRIVRLGRPDGSAA
jgi:hypothetical protein